MFNIYFNLTARNYILESVPRTIKLSTFRKAPVLRKLTVRNTLVVNNDTSTWQLKLTHFAKGESICMVMLVMFLSFVAPLFMCSNLTRRSFWMDHTIECFSAFPVSVCSKVGANGCLFRVYIVLAGSGSDLVIFKLVKFCDVCLKICEEFVGVQILKDGCF